MPQGFYHSPIGIIHIQEEDQKICSVTFWDQEITETTEATNLIKLVIIQLEEYFTGERSVFDFPYLQTGTTFQQKVWLELGKIQFGNTQSYLQLAHQFGDPLAIRAIASANGRNRLLIVLPCHRVIGKNGELTGYAGGLWRKKWLLQHEAVITGKAQTELF